MTAAFLDLAPGAAVSARGRTWRITHALGLDAVLAADVATGHHEQLQVEECRPPAPDGGEVGEEAREDATLTAAEAHPDELWAVAQRRFQVIKPLVTDGTRTKAQVEAAAAAAGVHLTTVYDWIALWNATRSVAGLIPRSRGRRKGTKLVDPAVEAVISAAIQKKMLTRLSCRPATVVKKVMMTCRDAGLAAPHPNTVRKRIRDIPAATLLRARGRHDLVRARFEPVRGHFPGAGFPYAVVQIDHSPADVVVLDDLTRQPMGRPWITLAIDVHSRMVVGAALSVVPPNAFTAGSVVAQAMLPKQAVLSRVGVSGDWPAWGPVATLHCDNAPEFKGHLIRRACEQYGIELKLRPIRTPHYGGNIERLMGTVQGELRNLPGATFPNPKERKGYDSDKGAALTFSDLERYLFEWIVNVYNVREHSGIDGETPLGRFERALLGGGGAPGRGVPAVPRDPERVRLDFLPWAERTITREYGVAWEGVHYWHEVLRPFVGMKEPGGRGAVRKFLVRRDPWLISPIYLWDPDAGRYHAIPYRDRTRPPTNIYTIRAAKQLLGKGGEGPGKKARKPDALQYEARMFAALARLEKQVDDAQASTKAARRELQKRARTRQAAAELGARGDPGAATGHGSRSALPDPLDDVFSQPVEGFDQVDFQSGRDRGDG